MISNSSTKKQLSPMNKRTSAEELNVNYEPVDEKSNVTLLIKPKSPKKPKNSKVKQIASMFNSKITQMMKGDAKYKTLVNEFSPEAKQAPKAIFVKPLPFPRTLPAKPKTPVPRPRTEAVSKDVQDGSKFSACFVPENVFSKLSVKQKAQLYTLFVEEMTKRNPKFDLFATKSNLFEKKNEVIVEKQVSVKDLLNELEFNRVFPKPTAPAAKAIQRMNSMKKACALRKNAQNKEFEKILKKKITKDSTLTRNLNNEQNQSPYSCFQNLQIENLFFSWFKEKHENINEIKDQSKQSEIDEEKQKSTIDRLLEEAIAKLEIEENGQRIEIPKPMPRKKKISNKKFSDSEESESGVSSLNKITSEESQPESHENQTERSENDFDKPLKPLRKKKLRKNAAVCKKELPTVEGQQITSTDSESDSRQMEMKLKNTMLLKQTSAEEDSSMPHPNETEDYMLEYLMKSINSPRKIRSAYTLTINDTETPSCTPRTSQNFAKPSQRNGVSSPEAQALNFSDSFTDQGFETATGSPFKIADENYSPPPTSTSSFNFTNNNFNFSTASKFREKSGFVAAKSFKNSTIQKPNAATTKLNISAKTHITNIGFSTPIRNQERHSFGGTSSAKRLFSPIVKTPRSNRNPLCDNEQRRNSLAMQVIREDQPLDTPSAKITSNIYSETEQRFFANAPTIEITKEATQLSAEKVSHFWLKCGDINLALDINYVDPERLRSLYDIFTQTSCDTKELHFGIDDNKFSVHGPLDISMSNRTPPPKDCSHYWISSGDLTIPFSGKYLLPSKIQRLFNFIKETTEETGILHFGVDEIAFSSVPEFSYQSPKYSVDSQYSMLVGLQTGDSNGLEGRSRYAWPHTKPVLMTDLDQSDNEADNFDKNESARLSFSPFGSNHFDLASLDNSQLNMPRNSLAMLNLESYCGKYESEPLDQLFESDITLPQKQHENSPKIPQQVKLQHSKNMTVPEMIPTIKNEEQRLSNVQQQLANKTKASFVRKDALDAYVGTPEYIEKLKSVVSNIGKIGCSNNLPSCTIDELESYMYYLRRYAEICFSSCTNHMGTVLDALTDYKIAAV